MGNLIKIPHSDLSATLERLDCKGVQPEHFEKIRKDDTFRDELAAFLKGERSLVPENRIEWVKFLADTEVPEKYREFALIYRKMATAFDLSYTGPVVAKVTRGFRWMYHAAKYGPCHNNWVWQRDWLIKNDEATSECLVFWVPRLIPGSISKTVLEQNGLLAKMREEYQLPAHHLAGFGSMSLVTALILGHFTVTKERVPLQYYWLRTDTLTLGVDGDCLGVGDFDGKGLSVNKWCLGGYRDSNLGCFALGVEPFNP